MSKTMEAAFMVWIAMFTHFNSLGVNLCISWEEVVTMIDTCIFC